MLFPTDEFIEEVRRRSLKENIADFHMKKLETARHIIPAYLSQSMSVTDSINASLKVADALHEEVNRRIHKEIEEDLK